MIILKDISSTIEDIEIVMGCKDKECYNCIYDYNEYHPDESSSCPIDGGLWCLERFIKNSIELFYKGTEIELTYDNLPSWNRLPIVKSKLSAHALYIKRL